MDRLIQSIKRRSTSFNSHLSRRHQKQKQQIGQQEEQQTSPSNFEPFQDSEHVPSGHFLAASGRVLLAARPSQKIPIITLTSRTVTLEESESRENSSVGRQSIISVGSEHRQLDTEGNNGEGSASRQQRPHTSSTRNSQSPVSIELPMVDRSPTPPPPPSPPEPEAPKSQNPPEKKNYKVPVLNSIGDIKQRGTIITNPSPNPGEVDVSAMTAITTTARMVKDGTVVTSVIATNRRAGDYSTSKHPSSDNNHHPALANIHQPSPAMADLPLNNTSRQFSNATETTKEKVRNGVAGGAAANDAKARRVSTGTLNRLILVAQALEAEVDSRRHNDINGMRLVCTIRTANMVLLLLTDLLIFTGLGQYHARNSSRLSLLLTADKWYYQRGIPGLPSTFAEMRLAGQFFAAAVTTLMLLCAFILQTTVCFKQRWRAGRSKLLSISYSFLSVPLSLMVFGLEMHYSSCPWLDDFYRTEIARRDFRALERHIDTQCSINGWALAGADANSYFPVSILYLYAYLVVVKIFSLLSCGLFVSEGLITAFFRSTHHQLSENSENDEKVETPI